MKPFATFSLLFFILSMGCQRPHLQINDRLPNFKFYDSENNPVPVHEYLFPDKLLLIHFWGASCCLEYSIPTMKAVSEVNKSKAYDRITVISVNLDYPQNKVRRIIKEINISHPVLNDPDDEFYKKEPKLKNVFPLAYFLVVDDKGIIINKMMGPQLLPAIKEILTGT